MMNYVRINNTNKNLLEKQETNRGDQTLLEKILHLKD